MLPLGLLVSGEKAAVVETGLKGQHGFSHACRSGEDKDAEQYRIEDMGLRVGKMVEMLNNEGHGPLLLKVDDSRIAIARGMAMKIMVRREDQ